MALQQQVSEKTKTFELETGDAEPLHVLAVDDSLIDRRVIEKLLKISAYKVTVVDSGTKALEFLGISDPITPVQVNVDESISSESDSSAQEEDQNSPKQGFEVNLIITDYCMPGMTGYELLKKIKGTSSLKEIPVVIMSSENVPNRINTCLAEGAEDFLLKPVRLADVKRLRCHVRQTRSNNESETASSKRKASSENFILESPKSRMRLNNVKVKVT